MLGMQPRATLREMWDEACRSGMVHAAYGMLVDMFWLLDALENDPDPPATEAQFAGIREDLMYLLGDNDGKQFSGWRELWKVDAEAFEKRAWQRIQTCVEE
jgi:hypothetical protein